MGANLSPSAVSLFRAVQKRFNVDYTDFYKSMIGHFLQSRNEGRRREFIAAKEDVQVVSESIDKLLVPRTDGVSQAEIDTVLSNMDRVEKNLLKHKDEAKKDAELNEKLGKVLTNRQLDATKLAQSINQMRGRIEKQWNEKPNIAEQWSSVSPETYKGVTGWGFDALKASMGPWGAAGGAAIKAVSGFMQRQAERKKTLEQEAFIGNLLNVGEQTPEHAQSAMSFITGRKPIGRSVESGMLDFAGTATPGSKKSAKAGDTSFAKTLGNVSNAFSKTTAGGGTIDAITISDGLKDFNEHHAGKSGWTKDLLKAVRDLGKVKSGGTLGDAAEEKGGNIISKAFAEIFDTIGDFVLLSLIPMLAGGVATIGAAITGVMAILGPILGVVGAALGGWALGKAIGGINIGGKSIDEHVQGVMGWAMGNTPEKNRAESLKGANASTVNFQDSYDRYRSQGLGHDEAMAKARADARSANAPAEKGIVPLTPTTGTAAVPIAASDIKDQSLMEGNLHKDLQMIIEELKKMGGGTNGAMPISGFDAFNIRNPLLSALSFGGVEIDE